MIRNIRIFHFDSPWPEDEESLSRVLEALTFKPCGPLSEKSAGWEAPVAVDEAAEDAPLCRRLAGADILQLRTQSRVLPAAAVREALQERVLRFRERTRLDPPPRELRRLKQETRDELLARALLKSERMRGCFLRRESLLLVDAATPARAEWFLDHLRPCLDGWQVRPFTPGQSLEALMQRMFLGQLPRGFSLGEECRLQSPLDAKSTATFRHVDLADPAIRQHATDGMRLTHIGLEFEESLAFVLAEDGAMSKLRLLHGDEDAASEADPQAREDAELTLLLGSLRRVIEGLNGG